MAVIKPIKICLPERKLASRVVSYPYDILSSEEARQSARDNPLSFLHITKSEIDLPPHVDPYSTEVYDTAKKNLRRFLDSGILVEDHAPAFYLYRLTMGGHAQSGIVCGIHVSQFEAGVVKEHELTLPEKLIDRTRHIDAVGAQTGPVFCTYRAQPGIDDVIIEVQTSAPIYDFETGDGIRHAVWGIDRRCARQIESEFKATPAVYIADGHHRAAAGAAIARLRKAGNPGHKGNEQYNYVMSVIFPHDQLKILEYNRLITDLGGLDAEEVLRAVGRSFILAKDFTRKKPAQAHEFGMYLEGRWYGLTVKPEILQHCSMLEELDSSLLQEHLLGPVFKIGDPRVDKRLKFIGGIRGIGEFEKLVDSGEYAAAFSLYPTRIDQVMNISDAGKIMPPKSTWFEPKLRDGFFTHLI